MNRITLGIIAALVILSGVFGIATAVGQALTITHHHSHLKGF